MTPARNALTSSAGGCRTRNVRSTPSSRSDDSSGVELTISPRRRRAPVSAGSLRSAVTCSMVNAPAAPAADTTSAATNTPAPLLPISSPSGHGCRRVGWSRRGSEAFEDSGAYRAVHARRRGAPVEPCCRGVSAQDDAPCCSGLLVRLGLGALLGEPACERTFQPLHQGGR